MYYAHADRYVCDTDHGQVPLKGLLSKVTTALRLNKLTLLASIDKRTVVRVQEYAKSRRAHIDPKQACSDVVKGSPTLSSDTVSFCVVDGEGKSLGLQFHLVVSGQYSC